MKSIIKIYNDTLKSIIVVGLLLFLATTVEAKNLSMQVGEVHLLKISDIEKIAVGGKDIISYRPMENGELLVIAESPGRSTLFVWRRGNRKQKYVFDVEKQDNSHRLSIAKELITSVGGLTVRDVDGHLLLEGLISPSDKLRVETLTETIDGAINLSSTRNFDVKKMVGLDVKIIELNSQTLKRLGLRWNSQIAGPSAGFAGALKTNNFFKATSPGAGVITDAIPLGDGSFYGSAGIATTIGSMIDLLEETGEARVLAEPKLSTRSGTSASFHAGGELPIPTTNENGVVIVEFLEFGVLLDIEPIVDEHDNILTKVKTEISNPDFAHQAEGIPSLSKRVAETVVNLQDGETVVMSGLKRANQENVVTKVPFLGDLPWIGWAFRSTQLRVDETELVIMVTPRIVAPGDEWNTDLISASERIEDGFVNTNDDQGLME